MDHPRSSLGILSAMRFATPVVMLISAVLLAGCDNVAAPKPDTAGDAAFVTKMKQLCSAAPALTTITADGGAGAIITAAEANYTIVNNLDAGLVQLTPSLSSSSPLAVPITDLALMLDDMQIRYVKIEVAAKKKEPAEELSLMAKLALTRATQARSDLAQIGVSSCLN
jgi:hypothetical protein